MIIAYMAIMLAAFIAGSVALVMAAPKLPSGGHFNA